MKHRNFHRALISNCGSRWLIEFCDQLANQAERYIFVANIYNDARRDGNIEHEALKKAALEGLVEAAEQTLTEHYSRTLRAIEEVLI